MNTAEQYTFTVKPDKFSFKGAHLSWVTYVMSIKTHP